MRVGHKNYKKSEFIRRFVSMLNKAAHRCRITFLPLTASFSDPGVIAATFYMLGLLYFLTCFVAGFFAGVYNHYIAISSLLSKRPFTKRQKALHVKDALLKQLSKRSKNSPSQFLVITLSAIITLFGKVCVMYISKDLCWT